MTSSSEQQTKKLWRYMPLISLLDILQTGELILPKADSFNDMREGYVGLDAMLQTVSPKLHARAKEALGRQLSKSFVTCWHLSSSESVAMWKVYGVHAFSVALGSNVGKVMSACHEYCKDLSCTGMFGEVIYENYVADGKLTVTTVGIPFGYSDLPAPSGILTLFMKAKAFSYEQEWRLVLHKSTVDEPAIRVPVGDLQEFIEAIYVSPEAPDWVTESITRLVSEQFGFTKIPVSKSPLSKHFGI